MLKELNDCLCDYILSMSVMGAVQILPLVLPVSLLYKELLLASNETPVKKREVQPFDFDYAECAEKGRV